VKKLALLATVLALAISGVSCGGQGNTLTTRASFTDVADLSASAPVMLNDIRIGTVKKIELQNNHAMVTMEIDRSARVPRDVIARVRRTSLLGERIVDLDIPPELPTTAPLLQNEEPIRRTLVRPDLEDLVREGTQVLGGIPASEVATLVDEGAKGFGKRGPELRSLLKSFNKIVGTFGKETGTIKSILESANQLNTTIASKAGAHGLAVQNTNRALQVLREESGRLEDAIRALNRLAVGGAGIMRSHFASMNRFWGEMRSILGSIQAEQGNLVQFLYWNLLHNRNTQMVEYGEFNQITQDFVFCKFNENPGEPARTCHGG
jgi:phospholipid/cholesterol/gamma-HCH transport system substrate-binding protein